MLRRDPGAANYGRDPEVGDRGSGTFGIIGCGQIPCQAVAATFCDSVMLTMTILLRPRPAPLADPRPGPRLIPASHPPEWAVSACPFSNKGSPSKKSLLLANDCGTNVAPRVDDPHRTGLSSATAGRTLGQEAAGMKRVIRSDHFGPVPVEERP